MGYIQELKEIVGADNVRDDLVERQAYSRDMSVHVGVPDVIVLANTTEQASKIMALGNKLISTRGVKMGKIVLATTGDQL